MSAMTPEILRLLIVLLVTVIATLIGNHMLKRAGRLVAQTDNVWDDALISAARKPLPVMIWVIGLAVFLHLVHLQTGEQLLDYLAPVRNIGFITCVAWFLFRLIHEIAANIAAKDRENERGVDLTTVNGLSKLARISVVVVALLTAMQTLGFSISGLVAFGGIGGIAVGFAAKDLLANLFGGVMVHLDRPFNVGDSIRSPDKQIEGKVEHIGWRQTSLRAINMTLLYIPNSLFTTIVVENVTRMSHRRIQETIGLRYSDIDKLPALTASIKAMLEQHPGIDNTQNIVAAFNQFADSSLNISLLASTKVTALMEFQSVKQDILFKVAQIVADHGADFAFPTQTVHINPLA